MPLITTIFNVFAFLLLLVFFTINKLNNTKSAPIWLYLLLLLSSSDSECGSQLPCDQLVSPMALAACTRVDSCFAPWFVPSLGVSLQLAQLDIHLCHHLEELGTGRILDTPSKYWV